MVLLPNLKLLSEIKLLVPANHTDKCDVMALGNRNVIVCSSLNHFGDTIPGHDDCGRHREAGRCFDTQSYLLSGDIIEKPRRSPDDSSLGSLLLDVEKHLNVTRFA